MNSSSSSLITITNSGEFREKWISEGRGDMVDDVGVMSDGGVVIGMERGDYRGVVMGVVRDVEGRGVMTGVVSGVGVVGVMTGMVDGEGEVRMMDDRGGGDVIPSKKSIRSVMSSVIGISADASADVDTTCGVVAGPGAGVGVRIDDGDGCTSKDDGCRYCICNHRRLSQIRAYSPSTFINLSSNIETR